MFQRWSSPIGRARPQVHPYRGARPGLEALENRLLPAVTFDPPVDYPTGAFATSQTVGDFRGDGHLDLAVANRGTDSVSVLLGNGDGSFQRAVNYHVGSNPVYVTEGDFRANGQLDLVVANRDSGTVSVLLGNGNGTFRSAVNYRTGAEPFSVTVGDFTGNGKLDLAVADFGQSDNSQSGLSILLGNGDGTFRSATTTPAGEHPTFVAAGDFRHSGTLDLAVVDYGDDNSVGSGVRIFQGNGDGTFRNTAVYNTGVHSDSVAVGDLRSAGLLDLVVTNSGDTQNNGSGVSVLLGNGDGTFQNAVNYRAGGSPRHVAIADLDNDGRPDLAVVNTALFEGTPSVNVFLGDGDATFQTPQYLAVNSFPASVAAAPFFGDGRLDLAVTSYLDGAISILKNTTPIFSNLLVTGFPSLTTAGSAGAVAVIARNSDGTIATNYQGTVHFSSTDPQASLPDDYTFQASDNGVHLFTVTLKTAGSQALTATDTANGAISGTQAGIVVQPAAASQLLVQALPVVAAGSAFDVTVTAVDPFGNIDPTYAGTVHFTSSDTGSGVALPVDYTFTAADQGVHRFPGGVTLVTAGDQVLQATDSATGISGTATVTVLGQGLDGVGGGAEAKPTVGQPWA